MDWLIGILLLVVGSIIGFFVAKFVNGNNSLPKENESNEQTIKELMAQQASSYLLETRKIAQQFEQQAQVLQQQVEAYEQVLKTDEKGLDGDNRLDYFGEHASSYLRNKSTKQARSKSSANVQPLDFSSESSGLFKGEEETKTN
jgi:uncharacterized membrane-anchored protein YhcB (DUF1043 family)